MITSFILFSNLWKHFLNRWLWEQYINEELAKEYPRIFGNKSIKTLHVWNHLLNPHPVRKLSKSIYTLAAHDLCPITMRSVDDIFWKKNCLESKFNFRILNRVNFTVTPAPNRALIILQRNASKSWSLLTLVCSTESNKAKKENKKL